MDYLERKIIPDDREIMHFLIFATHDQETALIFINHKQLGAASGWTLCMEERILPHLAGMAFCDTLPAVGRCGTANGRGMGNGNQKEEIPGKVGNPHRDGVGP